jgi:hypothetical protein
MTDRNPRRAWAAALRKNIRPGNLYHVEFQHDNVCLIYSPARICTCNATRVLRDADGRALATVEGAGPHDPLEVAEAMR